MFPTVPIIPQYKLLMCYDIRRNMNNSYYRYVVREFVPALSEMDIYVVEAWHTAYGDYPRRQVEYVVDDIHVLTDAFDDPHYLDLEGRLKRLTSSYSRKIVPYKRGFQF
jgi:hypothetical protein